MRLKNVKRILAKTLAVALAVTSCFVAPADTYAAQAGMEALADEGGTSEVEEEYAGYLFAYFTGSSRAIHFALSSDGYHYTALNGNKAVVEQTVGRKSARDPYIIKGQDGDYYMVATDLVGGNKTDELDNNGNYVWGANDSIVTWHSKDLINWDNETLITIRGVYDNTKADNQKFVWAPEAIWDAERGEYMIYWSMQGGDEYGDSIMIWYAHTKDFKTLTEKPKVLYNPSPTGLNLAEISGGGTDCIDADIIERDGKFYMYYKWSGGNKAGIQLAVADELLGEYMPIGYDPSAKDQPQSPGQMCGPAYVEGGDVYKLNNQDKWILIADHNWSKFYGMAESTDLVNWTTIDDNACEINFSYGDGNPKHGAVIPVTAEQYNALWEKWGTTEIEGTGGSEAGLNHTVDSAYPDTPEGSSEKPIAAYDFSTIDGTTVVDASGNDNDATLNGTEGSGTNQWSVNDGVLFLNNSASVTSGSGNGCWMEFPKIFDEGMDTMTLSFDVNLGAAQHKHVFTTVLCNPDITCDKDAGKYLFGKVLPSGANAHMTVAGYGHETQLDVNSDINTNTMINIMYIIKPDRISILRNGVLLGEIETSIKISDIGPNTVGYLAKSCFANDGILNAKYDNVKIYNRALTDAEILEMYPQEIAKTTLQNVEIQGASIIKEDIDEENKIITEYVSVNNSQCKDFTNVTVKFSVKGGYKATGVKGLYNLMEGANIHVVSTVDETDTEDWTVKTVLCNNPAIPGLYADPDIDVFDGKYYIYPTTDGFTGWNTQKFHVFSSEDLVSWKDEGVILDLSAGDVAWANTSDCYAWAPAIEAKNGKYYFYFCGRNKADNQQAIGVAVADSPTGPFVAEKKPLMTAQECRDEGGVLTQAIDPAIYTDEETGDSYMLFGNGGNGYNIVKLNDDMISWDPATLYHYPNGTFPNFRESIHVFKKDGKYHFTWSCNDTGSEDYSIAYAVADSLYPEQDEDGEWGDFTVETRGTILAKIPGDNILGTGHHCFVNIPGTEEYYISYARFGTPLSAYEGDSKVKGTHREICLDKVSFDEDGYIKKITPTNLGITEGVLANLKVSYKAGKGGKLQLGEEQKGYFSYVVEKGAAVSEITAVCDEGYKFVAWSDGVLTETRDSVTIDKDVSVMAIFEKIQTSTEKPDSPVVPGNKPVVNPVKAPAAVGTVTRDTKDAFVVTSANAKAPEVALKAISDKKTKAYTVPQTIVSNGVTYKVTSIAANAFKGNTRLKSVVIPEGITLIGKNAFSGCKNLKKITIKSTVLKKVGGSAFKKINAKATIKVPKAKKKAYTKLLKKKGQAKTVKIK